MSAERACFNRRKLRMDLGSRVSRRAGTKTFGIGGVRNRQQPSGRVGEKINDIRQNCGCEVHVRMRENINS